jgi:hypothetical protein
VGGVGSVVRVFESAQLFGFPRPLRKLEVPARSFLRGPPDS